MSQTYTHNDTDVTDRVQQARDLWFDPHVENWEERLFNLVPTLQQPIQSVAKIFHDNILSARHAVSLPFNMMFGNSLMEIRKAEENRLYLESTNGLGHEPDEDEKESLQQRAKEQSMPADDAAKSAYLQAGEAMAWLRLLGLTNHGAIYVSHQEVLTQGVVLLWGYFEAFVGELFVAAIKANPRLDTIAYGNSRIASNVSMRTNDYLNPANWAVNREEIHFNQINAMATSYQEILTPARAANVDTALRHSDLNILMERRHKIVHKAGIIDQLYLNKTRESLPLGARLPLSPRYVAKALRLVRDTGITVLQQIDEEVQQA